MLLIGAGADRRTALLRAAAARHGVRLDVIEWSEVIANEESLNAAVVRARRAGHRWCKIDPPPAGTISDALILRGWQESTKESRRPDAIRHGELAHLQWWYAGLAISLESCSAALKPLRLLNPISQILLMCDKWACQRHLHRSGLDVPELLGEVQTLDLLEQQFPAHSHPALFIKARYGSSAAGVIAMRRHPDGRIAAYSSARLNDGALFNHLRVTRYEDRETIGALIAALAKQGAYAERWVPKPRHPTTTASTYDLRVVAFRGRARQRIARVSHSPLTNLHLGNRRAQPHWLSREQLRRLDGAIERAAAAFDSSLSIGFDTSLSKDRFHIFEANAFGDLLPDLEHEGSTTHDDQIRMVAADEC